MLWIDCFAPSEPPCPVALATWRVASAEATTASEAAASEAAASAGLGMQMVAWVGEGISSPMEKVARGLVFGVAFATEAPVDPNAPEANVPEENALDTPISVGNHLSASVATAAASDAISAVTAAASLANSCAASLAIASCCCADSVAAASCCCAASVAAVTDSVAAASCCCAASVAAVSCCCAASRIALRLSRPGSNMAGSNMAAADTSLSHLATRH